MLRHNRATPSPPSRVVVLGAGGFIGGTIARHLLRNKIATLALGRAELDLLQADAGKRLAEMLRPSDSLVVVSARAPCKNVAMMIENLRMIETVAAALALTPVAHVVYISSDAIYADGPLPLSEASPLAPTSLHGTMHLAREQVLASAVGSTPFAILRPTLVYGPGDPHNGYGPNKFRRLASKGEPIILFGLGEERRDHVHVDDVAEIARLVLLQASSGALNVATGEVASFRQVAEMVVRAAGKSVMIGTSARSGPMPHNGYRPFNASATLKAFPGFRYMPLSLGIARMQAEEARGAGS